jgi:hypothetical protein
MKKFFLTLFFLLLALPTYAADWKLYFENQMGNKFFIDIDSIHQTPEGTKIVWEMISSSEKAEVKRTLEKLYEIDCSRRKYKTLQGTLYDHNTNEIKPLEKGGWEYFEPSELSTALFKVVCKNSMNEQ